MSGAGPRGRRVGAVVACALALLAGCREATPALTIAEAPPGVRGGPDRMARIAGRVEGARPGDAIVLYARSGLWYVQPYQLKPFTPIGGDGRWSASIHLGTEYAALLVGEAYTPPPTLEAVPEAGGLVRAVARARGSEVPPELRPRTVSFSGYEWTVRDSPSERGGYNHYAAGNVRVAADGALHLSLRKHGDRWTSAEVVLTRSLGYGTYTFSVRDTGPLDPAALLTFYTYDEDAPSAYFREMAIALRRPDARARLGGQYILQPNHVAANVSRFIVPPGPVTHSLRWEPGRAVFAADRGTRPSLAASNGVQHEFPVGVPSTGKERVRVALYYFRNAPLPPQRDVEVVLERFQHFP